MKHGCLSESPAGTLTTLALWLGAGLSSAPANPQSEPSWSRKALDALLAPVFINKMADYYVAGAAISIVKDGEIVYMRGFGHGDVFAQNGVDPRRTVFRIGSVTKTLTGVALLQLVDRGEIELDASVARYLGDLEMEGAYHRPVLVRDLLTHTAGFDQLGYGRHASSEDGVVPLKSFLTDSLVRVRPAGTLSCYDTYGITLAGYLVEQLSGSSYADYLREHLFAPLGMHRAGIRLRPEWREDFAVGYSFRGEWKPERWEYMNTAPASSVNATAAGMANYMRMLLGEGEFEGRRILSAELARAMLTRQHANDPRLPGYGYTFWEDRRHGVQAFSHGGSMTGFGCILYLVPEHELGIFIACNQESGRLQDAVLSTLMRRYFERRQPEAGPRPATFANARTERFVGSYANNMYNHSRPARGGWRMRPVEVAAGDGHLVFRGRRARPVGPLTFEFPDRSLMVFRADAAGNITEMLIAQEVYERVGADRIRVYREASAKRAVDLDAAVLARYAGRYKGPEGILVVRAADNGLDVDMPGRGTVRFRPSSEREFFLEGHPVTLEFETHDGEPVRRAKLVAGGDTFFLVRQEG